MDNWKIFGVECGGMKGCRHALYEVVGRGEKGMQCSVTGAERCKRAVGDLVNGMKSCRNV